MQKSFMTDEELRHYLKDTAKCRSKCSCGHTIFIPCYKDYVICSYCGHRVENRKKSFISNLKKALDRHSINVVQ